MGRDNSETINDKPKSKESGNTWTIVQILDDALGNYTFPRKTIRENFHPFATDS